MKSKQTLSSLNLRKKTKQNIRTSMKTEKNKAVLKARRKNG